MKDKISHFMTNKKLLNGLAFFIILAYFFPFFYLGEDSTILVHDNLDSNLYWVKLKLENYQFFSLNYDIPQALDGVKNSNLAGSYDISLIFFKSFGLFYGYLINKLIMSIIAFIGISLLLTKIIRPKDSSAFIIVGVSLLFALLPFWSFTLTVCGLPLVLYAFLNLRDNEAKKMSYLIIVLFPFYSSLVTTGVFLIIILSLILFYDTYKKRSLNLSLFIGIFVFCVLYVISHTTLFYTFLFSPENVVSHRVEMVTTELTSNKSYEKTLRLFLYGQYHAHSLHKYILYPIIFVFILQFFQKKIDKKYTAIFIFIVLTSLLYGFMNWEVASTLKMKLWNIIPLKFERFHFLHPMFWYLLLGIALTVISTKIKFGKVIAALIITLQLGFIFSYHDNITQKDGPTYKQFYAEALFENIKDFIQSPPESYRVISIGIHPAIAQYNGFYCLDGYIPDYPLEYKHKFRKIIANELEKDSDLKKYFDNWGSRCYAFSSEQGRDFLNPNPEKINDLDLNYDALKQLGGKYLISSSEINVKSEKSIELLNVFEHSDSYWKIYLYKVI